MSGNCYHGRNSIPHLTVRARAAWPVELSLSPLVYANPCCQCRQRKGGGGGGGIKFLARQQRAEGPSTVLDLLWKTAKPRHWSDNCQCPGVKWSSSPVLRSGQGCVIWQFVRGINSVDLSPESHGNNGSCRTTQRCEAGSEQRCSLLLGGIVQRTSFITPEEPGIICKCEYSEILLRYIAFHLTAITYFLL